MSTFGTYMITWLGYPLFYGFTGFISSASRALILTQYKSPLSTCTILFIRSVTIRFLSFSLLRISWSIRLLISVGILALSTCTNITCSGTYTVLKLVVVDFRSKGLLQVRLASLASRSRDYITWITFWQIY